MRTLKLNIFQIQTIIDNNTPVTREQLIDIIDEGADLTHVNTSEITDMSWLFAENRGMKKITGSITHWDTSNVTNMDSMFFANEYFNQKLNWDTSGVTSMKQMFYGTRSFNQPLCFDTSNVTDMHKIFCFAKAFNVKQNWDTSRRNKSTR